MAPSSSPVGARAGPPIDRLSEGTIRSSVCIVRQRRHRRREDHAQTDEDSDRDRPERRGGGALVPAIAAQAVTTSDRPDFGPNVTVYDPSVPASTIQADIDAAFDAQLRNPTAQFGDQRHAFLFEPGTYGRVFANLGFYTALQGLGKNPDDVTIQGAVNVDSGWNYGDEKNATQNFWRSVENLAVEPEAGVDRWAVSQAAPMRRVTSRAT